MTGTDVTRLLGVDPAAVPHAARISLLADLAKARDLVEAAELRVLAVLAEADRSPKQWVREEVACALSIAPSTAAGRLHDAADLAGLLPTAFTAVSRGTLAPRRARVLLDATRRLPAAVRATVEATVLPRAAGRTSSEFTRTVRRAIAATDPRGLEERHHTARIDRHVTVRPADDGMAELHALLPADGAAVLMARLAHLARGLRTGDATAGRPARTADQRRADALTLLAEGHDAHPRADAVPQGTGAPGPGEGVRNVDSGLVDGPNGPSPARISVHVTVPLATLCGGEVPGELAGHGPIPAGLARRLATSPHAVWRRIVTDPVGIPLDAGRTYRPSAALAALVRARDATCRFPGCSRPARTTDLDHVAAWHDGGTTSADNLHCLCSRHHHLKHEAPGWSVTRSDDGTTHWTTPAGHIHGKPPDDTVESYLDIGGAADPGAQDAASPSYAGETDDDRAVLEAFIDEYFAEHCNEEVDQRFDVIGGWPDRGWRDREPPDTGGSLGADRPPGAGEAA